MCDFARDEQNPGKYSRLLNKLTTEKSEAELSFSIAYYRVFLFWLDFWRLELT